MKKLSGLELMTPEKQDTMFDLFFNHSEFIRKNMLNEGINEMNLNGLYLKIKKD